MTEAPAPTSADSLSLHIRFPLKFSGICGLILVVITFTYKATGASMGDTLVFFSAGIVGVGTIITAFYTARTLNLELSQEDRRIKAEEKRDLTELRKAALRFGERWNDPTMFHVRDTFREIATTHQNSPQKDLVTFIESKKTNVIHVLNFLEEIAHYVELELVDTKVAQDDFEGIICTAWSVLENWIKEHRKERHRPKLWIKVEVLYGKWK